MLLPGAPVYKPRKAGSKHDLLHKVVREHLSELPTQTQDRIVENWKGLERNWHLVKLATKPTPKIRVSDGPKTAARLVAYLETFQCKSLYDSVQELWP